MISAGTQAPKKEEKQICVFFTEEQNAIVSMYFLEEPQCDVVCEKTYGER
jgi:hypothetical protein